MATRISGGVCNTYIHIDLVLEETATSLENNTSTVSWKLVGYMGSGGTSSYWYSNSYHTINVKINGATVYSLGNTTQKAISIGTNHSQASPTVIASGTVTVPHDNDGSKVCSASFSVAYRYSSAFTWSGAGNITLTTIARTSVPTITSDTFEFGDPITFKTNRASTAFTHKLYYSVAGGSDVLIAEGITDSYTWIVPLELMKYFPDKRSGIINFRLATYNGSTLIGSSTEPVSFLVPKEIVPSITAINCTDTTAYSSIYGGYVQGRSQVMVSVAASGNYSNIVGYKITVNGATYTSNNCVTGELTTAGTNTISVTVTDSRGRTATKTTTISVLAYSLPTISKLKAYRCTSAGVADEEGAYMKVELTASITALNNKNSKKFVLVYKAATATSYTTHTTYTSAYTWNTSYIIAANTDTAYNIQLVATDAFGGASYTVDVGTAFTLMDFRSTGKGVAFGKVSESDNFDVNLPALFRQAVTGESSMSAKKIYTTGGADLDTLKSGLATANANISSLQTALSATLKYAETGQHSFRISSTGTYSYTFNIGFTFKEIKSVTISRYGVNDSYSSVLTLYQWSVSGSKITVTVVTNQAEMYNVWFNILYI